jgi:ribosome biogenesis GTPase / thiamine phosphate phosphatase
LRNVGIEALREHVRPGNTLVLLGSSGVGKSSLINCLAGEELMRVGDIRELDARGRHTTTWSELTVLPSGGVLIDTPGLRDVQLWANEASIAETFSEIISLSAECRFTDCRHGAEPGCAVQSAISEGSLDPGRLASYQTQIQEIRSQADVGRWMRNSDGRPARRRKRR